MYIGCTAFNIGLLSSWIWAIVLRICSMKFDIHAEKLNFTNRQAHVSHTNTINVHNYELLLYYDITEDCSLSVHWWCLFLGILSCQQLPFHIDACWNPHALGQCFTSVTVLCMQSKIAYQPRLSALHLETLCIRLIETGSVLQDGFFFRVRTEFWWTVHFRVKSDCRGARSLSRELSASVLEVKEVREVGVSLSLAPLWSLSALASTLSLFHYQSPCALPWILL